MEQAETDEEWIEDDQREQSSGQFEEQRGRNGVVSEIEEKWQVKIDVTHGLWPWIAEQA